MTGATVDITRPHRKRMNQEHLEVKRSGARNVNGMHTSGTAGDGGTTQSSSEASGLWTVTHWE